DGRAADERLECGLEAAVGEDRRVDAARELAQLLERLRELRARAVEERGRAVGVVAELAAGEAERERERDEALLRAGVEVPLQPPPLGVPGLDDAGARGPQLFLLLLALRHVGRRHEIGPARRVERPARPRDEEP